MQRMDWLNFVNGRWVGEQATKQNVINPATGNVIGSVPMLNKQGANDAIAAAHRVLPKWASLSASERATKLRTVADLMKQNEDELAKIMTLEMGKPLRESRGEVHYAASFLEWFAEEGKRVYGRIIPGRAADHRIHVLKQPVGVVAAITPWNFPAAMITRKLGPALAAGCTFVVKPPLEAPLTAVKLMDYCQQADIPHGVVNLVTGKAAHIGSAFMTNPAVRKVSFTGSTDVGKLLIEQSAEQVKNLSLELGGHAPLIVFDDADLEKAAEGAVASKFRNSGQTCICVNRIYVQRGVEEEFIRLLAEKVRHLNVGDGFDDSVHVGPMIDKQAYSKVSEHVEDALDNGAKIVVGGESNKVGGGGTYTNDQNVYFYQPTILQDVNENMRIMHEETFGPVAPVQTFNEMDEAIRLANNTVYGLAAYFYTRDVERGLNVSEALEYGIVCWNDAIPSAAQAPFGGMKESGLGREGGTEGIDAYLETKYVSIGQ